MGGAIPLFPLYVFMECRRGYLTYTFLMRYYRYGAETWTLRAADQKYLESFEMLCWRSMEKISWTDHVRNEEVLESMSRGISYTKYENRRLTGLVTSYVETAF